MKVKYHVIREVESNEEIKLVYCSSEDQLADIFTKVLPRAKFEILRTKLGVCSHVPAEEDQESENKTSRSVKG